MYRARRGARFHHAECRALLVLSPLLSHRPRPPDPPPRVHRHRYHGVLAPNAGRRERVTALATGADDNPTDPTPYPADRPPRSRAASQNSTAFGSRT
jgi:hypothetical protein